jgi:hypothetical protein
LEATGGIDAFAPQAMRTVFAYSTQAAAAVESAVPVGTVWQAQQLALAVGTSESRGANATVESAAVRSALGKLAIWRAGANAGGPAMPCTKLVPARLTAKWVQRADRVFAAAATAPGDGKFGAAALAGAAVGLAVHAVFPGS